MAWRFGLGPAHQCVFKLEGEKAIEKQIGGRTKMVVGAKQNKNCFFCAFSFWLFASFITMLMC
jgi:hypothetical protein